MCCASTSKVNTIQKAVKYQYGKVQKSIPVFRDDIATVGTVDNIRKGMQNCRRMEIGKKMICKLKKTKYMVITTGKKPRRINSRKSKRRNSSRNRYLQALTNSNHQIRKLGRSCTRVK